MTTHFLSRSDFEGLLEKIARQRRLLVQGEREGNYFYAPFPREGRWEALFNPYRPVEPVKSFFFPVVERVSEVPATEPLVVFGPKNCDLSSLRILDFVFQEGDFVDPFFEERRRSTVIVSGDCTDCRECCFCTLYGLNPFPESGFDMNLSPVEGGFLVEIGSERGAALLKEGGASLRDPSPAQLQEREEARSSIREKVEEQVQRLGLSREASLTEAVERNLDDPIWKEESIRCIECGACNFVCPTCHCFLLVDAQVRGGAQRFKNWDSCQYASFTRVAGGANPRAHRRERLRARFEKKFIFFPQNLEVIACTGCGRCSEACMGKIDIREILKRLTTGVVVG